MQLACRKDKTWDRWFGPEVVSDQQAQQMYTECWYRKHCVTLERGRLFVCSRIPKLANDEQGLLLGPDTTLDAITQYLNGEHFLPACKTCVPMMGLPSVNAGVQPDNRIEKMLTPAMKYLKKAIDG